MGVSGKGSLSIKFCVLACLLLQRGESLGLNLGLIAGDVRRPSNPLIIKKISRNSPIFINIHSKSAPPLSIPKLPPKPPPIKIKQPKESVVTPKLPRSILPPVLPRIPKLPRLPLIPPLLPPLLPFLPPFLPFSLIPRLPRLPKLTSPLKPLRVPILGQPLLQQALGSEIKPIKVPILKVKKQETILDKLLELKKRGSLTTAEFIRFKKLLLK